LLETWRDVDNDNELQVLLELIRWEFPEDAEKEFSERAMLQAFRISPKDISPPHTVLDPFRLRCTLIGQYLEHQVATAEFFAQRLTAIKDDEDIKVDEDMKVDEERQEFDERQEVLALQQGWFDYHRVVLADIEPQFSHELDNWIGVFDCVRAEGECEVGAAQQFNNSAGYGRY